eukprot:9669468-Alexandrium_andersonii.AAC.1
MSFHTVSRGAHRFSAAFGPAGPFSTCSGGVGMRSPRGMASISRRPGSPFGPRTLTEIHGPMLT